MNRISFACLLLISTFALAQAKPPAQKPAAPAAPPATAPKGAQKPPAPATPPAATAPKEATPAQLAPDAPVITIPGVCSGKAAAAECKTVVTRAQFEQLVDALAGGRQQNVPPAAKRQLAMQYSRLVLFAVEAEKKGLENSSEAQELLRFARLQALAQEMTRELQKQAQPTPAEVQKLYESNPQRFTELSLQRVMLPIKPAGEGKTNEAEMKTLADQLRQRASGGADFKTLQAEAFEKAGMTNPPETKQVVSLASLPPTQQSVAQLKPGEVSQVIPEANALYIYKLDSTRQIPLEQVRAEIEASLSQDKFQKTVESMLASSTPTLNPDYFGPAPAMPPGPGMRPGAAPAPPRQAPAPPKP